MFILRHTLNPAKPFNTQYTLSQWIDLCAKEAASAFRFPKTGSCDISPFNLSVFYGAHTKLSNRKLSTYIPTHRLQGAFTFSLVTYALSKKC